MSENENRSGEGGSRVEEEKLPVHVVDRRRIRAPRQRPDCYNQVVTARRRGRRPTKVSTEGGMDPFSGKLLEGREGEEGSSGQEGDSGEA